MNVGKVERNAEMLRLLTVERVRLCEVARRFGISRQCVTRIVRREQERQQPRAKGPSIAKNTAIADTGN